MKNILKSIVFLCLALASAHTAMASTLNGSITFTGNGRITTPSIIFKGSGNSVSSTGTIDLSGFQLGKATTFLNVFSFAEISPKNGGETMFSVTSNNGTQLLTFKVDNYGMVNGKLTFYGTLSLYAKSPTGGDNTLISSDEATLTYTENADGTTFSASISTAPEPSSLILLGTGLVSAGRLLTRRRRMVAA